MLQLRVPTGCRKADARQGFELHEKRTKQKRRDSPISVKAKQRREWCEMMQMKAGEREMELMRNHVP